MSEFVAINGRLVPIDDARVSVFDSGFMQGIGLFSTMRSYGGVVFRLKRHIQRIIDSSKALGWATSPDAALMRDSVQRVVAAAGDADARVRLTVTTGSLRATGDDVVPMTVVATSTTDGGYPPALYQRGVSVITSSYRQHAGDPTVGHKTTSYFSRLASLREAHQKGAFEMLWLTPADEVAEGAISSVFLVKNMTLMTPPLETPVLPGITRAAVLEIAAQQGIPVDEGGFEHEDIFDADEVFITNAVLGVMPVVKVDNVAVMNGRPGELTQQIMTAYAQMVETECGISGDADLASRN